MQADQKILALDVMMAMFWTAHIASHSEERVLEDEYASQAEVKQSCP